MTLKLTKKESAWGFFFLAAQFLVVPFVLALVFALLGTYSEAAINTASFYVNAALALVIFRRLLEQSIRNCAGRWKETLTTALRGLGLYWLVNIGMTMVILMVEPEFGNVNDQAIAVMLDESPLLLGLAIVFAAPLAEECLFRGWMFTGLARRSLPLAYAVTCGLFSAAHVVGYIGMYAPRTLLLCFVQYLGPSYVLCRTCHKNDSLCAPLLMHMTINAIACLIMG